LQILLRQSILSFVLLDDVHKRPKHVVYNRLNKHTDKICDWQPVISLYF